MAGNSTRKGAIRASKKGPATGTGGKNKKRLTGKGPTPKAEDRPYHAAAKRKKAVAKKSASKTTTRAAVKTTSGRSDGKEIKPARAPRGDRWAARTNAAHLRKDSAGRACTREL